MAMLLSCGVVRAEQAVPGNHACRGLRAVIAIGSIEQGHSPAPKLPAFVAEATSAEWARQAGLPGGVHRTVKRKK